MYTEVVRAACCKAMLRIPPLDMALRNISRKAIPEFGYQSFHVFTHRTETKRARGDMNSESPEEVVRALRCCYNPLPSWAGADQ